MFHTPKSINIQCQGHPNTSPSSTLQLFVTSAQSLASVGSDVLSIIRSHQKPTVLLQGIYSEEANHDQIEEMKRLDKRPSPPPSFLTFPHTHSMPSVIISLVPVPYLAGGVCSQCFAEGQNSQSPDCHSCYSPGGQSEFLLPMEDTEKQRISPLIAASQLPQVGSDLIIQPPLVTTGATQNAASLMEKAALH